MLKKLLEEKKEKLVKNNKIENNTKFLLIYNNSLLRILYLYRKIYITIKKGVNHGYKNR